MWAPAASRPSVSSAAALSSALTAEAAPWRTEALRSASFAPRMATPAFSMASSRRSRTRWVNVHSSTSESAFVGHDTMHRGPPGTFAHRSHATTDA